MKLSELMTRLSRGELSNLALGSEGSGEITEENRPKVIQYVNDGLIALYSRFILKESDVMIELQAHITNYHLIPKYAKSNNENPKIPHYILDVHCAPFKGDLIKILEVYDEFGCKYPLNDIEAYNSLFTPQPHILQVPYPVQGKALSVSYQASSEIITEDNLEDRIEIPLSLESALQNYVAYKAFNHMNGVENVNKAQDFLAQYESVCLGVEQKDLVNNTTSVTNTKFAKRGFV